MFVWSLFQWALSDRRNRIEIMLKTTNDRESDTWWWLWTANTTTKNFFSKFREFYFTMNKKVFYSIIRQIFIEVQFSDDDGQQFSLHKSRVCSLKVETLVQQLTCILTEHSASWIFLPHLVPWLLITDQYEKLRKRLWAIAAFFSRHCLRTCGIEMVIKELKS